MKKFFNKLFVILFSIFVVTTMSSCGKEGYSVVLWGIPESGLQDGDIVPVYLKSNISHVYVIGTPDGKKIEVPLWQISEPASRGKAKKIYSQYAEYNHKYAQVKIDGLPCRAEPVNTSKQVYRFRKGEIIKILMKGEGQVVTNGKEEFEGDWLRVITKDGTQGWCFSYSLTLFEMDVAGNKIGSDTEVQDMEVGDDVFEAIFNKTWYPESFLGMIESKVIDTTLFRTDYNFNIDTDKGKVSLCIPANKDNNTKAIKDSWEFAGYEKSGRNQYKLLDTPIEVTIRRDDFIVVRYNGPSGKPQDIPVIFLEDDVPEILAAEKTRRSSLYSKIVSNGPNYVSSSYGNLNFTSGYTFNWANFDLLVPDVIPAGSNNGGTISMKYGVNKDIMADYDGVMTFKFDGSNETINFFFKVDGDGLRLEDASNAKLEEGLFTRRSSTSLVLYFTAN